MLQSVCVECDDQRILGAVALLQKDLERAGVSDLPLDVQPPFHACAITVSIGGDGAERKEQYELSVTSERIRIRGIDAAGAFYGIQTLRQMLRSCGVRLPVCEINDYPDFACRGFYHDITRGKVPTLATLKSLIDTLAYYKINHLQLYVEHTFAFSGLPELWHDKDPLTANDIRELDAYCRERFIEFVPSLATFGHLYELLRIPRFEHLNELDIRASTLPHNLWDRMAHYTIDVSQKESFTLIKGMIDEYLPLFSSPYANICCDETFDLGKGKNKELAKKYGVGRLYTDFVKKLCGAVAAHGKTPMLWGDIVLHYPEYISEFPRDTVFLNWGYGADVTAVPTRTFAHASVRFMNCPGVSGWSRFANDITTASQNIRRMVSFGQEWGAYGILTTDWGDCGHVNFLANSFHGMGLGAALAWNTQSYKDDEGYDAAFSLLQYADAHGATGRLLRELGGLCPYHFGNLYAWAYGLDCMWNREKEVATWNSADLQMRRERAVIIAEHLRRIAAVCATGAAQQDYDEFVWSADAVGWMLWLLLYKRGAPIDATLVVRAGRQIMERFVRLWRVRNRESELRNVVATFETVFSRLAHA